MNCLRCGRETKDDHIFCDSCLETMKKYPVRPGTAVMLPRRKASTPLKKARRNLPPSPRDQIKKLKRQRNALWILIVLLMLILILLIGAIAYRYLDKTPKPGQNYAVAETTAAAVE